MAFGNNKHSKTVPKKRWGWLTLITIILVCAVVIPVAVVVSNKNKASSPQNNSASSNNGSGVSGSGSRSGWPTPVSGTPPRPTASVQAKPKWDFSKNKMIGVNLGNWLVLERWMSEDWFTQTSSLDSWDEWSFTQTVGANASNVLTEHWNSWITEKDVQQASEAGINTFRVPTGFWMWIPTLAGEPYVTNGQIAQLERLCQWAYARNMYLIIDLHGLPGSQNGEQQSGHNTTNPTFYQPLQQARADATVKAVVDWIAASPYYSIISAVEAANEPRPYTTEQLAMLRAYYERSYTTIQSLGAKAPAMMFADGFVSGDKLAYWYDFAAARVTSPPSLIFTDHPYPGYFPAQNNSANILEQTCTDAARYQNFPVPTCITEWSLRTGIQDSTFEKQYYTQQLTAWSYFAGSAFWSFRVLNSTVNVLADPVAQYQWSFQGLLERGSIPVPSSANQSTTDFLTELGTPCGAAPALQT